MNCIHILGRGIKIKKINKEEICENTVLRLS